MESIEAQKDGEQKLRPLPVLSTSPLVNWIDDRKKSTKVLVATLVLAYALAKFGPAVPWVLTAALVCSIVCPFALFLVWIIDSPLTDKLLARRWTAVLLSGAAVVYGMFANTYASDLINNYFRVDPAHFTVTSIFVTTIYLLVGVFQPFVLFPAWLALVLLGGIALPMLMVVDSWRTGFKRVGLFILALLLVSASTQSLGLLEHHLPLLAERVALAADFNEKHRCTAHWDLPVDKVVFLADGNVLAHIQDGKYAVLPCIAR